MTKSGLKPIESADSALDFLFENYWIQAHRPEHHPEYPQADAFSKRRIRQVIVEDIDGTGHDQLDNDAIKAANKIVDSIATAMDFLRDQGIELKVGSYEVYYEGNKYSLNHLFSPYK